MINKFGERLKGLIIEKGITQKILAQKTQLGQSTISEWINGISQPKADYILLLADFFDVTTDYLLGRTED